MTIWHLMPAIFEWVFDFIIFGNFWISAIYKSSDAYFGERIEDSFICTRVHLQRRKAKSRKGSSV